MPDPVAVTEDTLSPVDYPAPFAATDSQPEEGIGLCLSGGGYRAMLFHAGVLWRLNELGFLPQFKRISSVSGGSITSAQLGLAWKRGTLAWNAGIAQNFVAELIEPIRRLASETIDRKSILGGLVTPRVSINDKIVKSYRKHLYGDATLQDLPDGDGAPRFVINATNVQTGAIMRFSRPYMADYLVGEVRNPTIELAVAVAASSAFPPVLSPARITLKEGEMRPLPGARLHRPPYTTHVVLTDGGVYDNLGLETVWKRYKTVIVSDGGGQMEEDPDPKTNWAQHALRVNSLIDNQVRALRKRQVVGSLQAQVRMGTCWRMRGNIRDYSAPRTLPCPINRTMDLARTPTRLKAMPKLLQEQIINWGYAICDAGMRTWVVTNAPPPADFPYPASGV